MVQTVVGKVKVGNSIYDVNKALTSLKEFNSVSPFKSSDQSSYIQFDND